MCFLLYTVFFFISLLDLKSQWEYCSDSLAYTGNTTYIISACGNKLFAYNSPSNKPSLYMSVDNGEHWTENKLNYKEDIGAYTFFQKDNYILMGTSEIGILLSADSGDTWIETINEIPKLSVYEFACLGNKIFAACDKGILESIDSGKTWKQINDSLLKGINSISVSENKIYAVAPFGGKILVSSDSGNTWKNIQDGLVKDLNAWAIRSNDDDIFICSFPKKDASGAGFYYSSNEGESWEARMNGLPLMEKRTIYDFEIYKKNIIVSMFSSISSDKYDGIFISTDKGKSWEQRNSGLFSRETSNITCNDEYAFVSVARSGIYRAKLTDLFSPTSIEDTEIEYYTHHFFASSPRPTPTNNIARILISWDRSFDLENAITGVCDSQGNIIEGRENMAFTYLSEYLAELTWDCSALGSGAYFIAVRHNGITDCIPVVVVK